MTSWWRLKAAEAERRSAEAEAVRAGRVDPYAVVGPKSNSNEEEEEETRWCDGCFYLCTVRISPF